MPKDQIMKYETAVKADKFVLMVHGTAAEEENARTTLAHALVPEIA